MWVTAELLRNVAILIQPVMPTSMEKLLDLLAVPTDRRAFNDLGEDGALAGGVALPAPVGIFPALRGKAGRLTYRVEPPGRMPSSGVTKRS